VPDHKESHPLRPALKTTENQLQEALEEVCEDTDVPGTDTDELIRIEETLASATEAAKKAISIRRKMRQDS